MITPTHLELAILECEVRWALGSITTNKASGSDGSSVELFEILKVDAVKVLHSICQQIWTGGDTHHYINEEYVSKFGELSSGHRTGKVHFSFQSQRKAMSKRAQSTTQLHSSPTLVKYC